MENLDLQEIRGRLDEIDTRLVELFEKRMELCGQVAEFKIGTGKAVYDGSGKSRSWTRWQPWSAMNSTGREYTSSFHRL